MAVTGRKASSFADGPLSSLWLPNMRASSLLVVGLNRRTNERKISVRSPDEVHRDEENAEGDPGKV